MLLSSVLLGATLVAVSPAALCSEPCSPRTMLPYHFSAFALGTTDRSDSASAATVASHLAGSELKVQAECLAWEATLYPKAEFIGVVPLGAPVPSGAYRPRVAAPQASIPAVSSTRGGPLLSSSPSANLFEATPGTGAFTLGVTLIPVP